VQDGAHPLGPAVELDQFGPNQTRALGSVRRWVSSTGSRWSWGTKAGALGLTTRHCSRVG
jgi:hypothetical protein